MTSSTRKLGNLEKWFAPPYISNVIVPTLLSLKKIINEDLLRQAVLVFIKSQPNLKSGLKQIDGDLYFSPLENFEDYFEVLSPDFNWKEICLKYSNSFLRQDFLNFPAIKVFFIAQSSSSAYLIPVQAHHAADGSNGMTIVNDILTIYTKLSAGESFELHHLPPPSAEEMLAAAMPEDNINKLFENFVKISRKEFSVCNYSVPFEQITRTEALYYTSSTEIYDKFVATCRSRLITVGAALTSAMYFALGIFAFNHVPGTPDEITFGVNMPVNLRGRTPLLVENNCLGVAVTQILLTRPLTKKVKFWDFTRETGNIMRRKMGNENLLYLFDFETEPLVWDSIERKRLVDTIGVSYQACVSNMKRYPGSVEYQDFTVESIHCVGGKWILNTVYDLMVYSTNKFNLSIIHRGGDKNIEQAKMVSKYLQYIIENPENLDCELQDLIKTVEL